MGISCKLLKKLNSFFHLPLHPFNLSNDGKISYPEWQYEKGEETIKFYLNNVSISEMFEGKTVLDVGCGGGGKTIYYASQGVEKIYGLEILEKYREDALKLARIKGVADKFEFIVADAANTGFKDNSIDTIIMNDAMEHVDKPLEVLNECYRILKQGGKLFVNFPPYYHPYGAHLSDALGVPWVHILFSEKTLISVYKDLVKFLPDGEERISFRISRDDNGREYFSYINKMTITKYNKILKNTKFKSIYYKEEPLRSALKVLTRIPIIKELTVKMVVGILSK